MSPAKRDTGRRMRSPATNRVAVCTHAERALPAMRQWVHFAVMMKPLLNGQMGLQLQATQWQMAVTSHKSWQLNSRDGRLSSYQRFRCNVGLPR